MYAPVILARVIMMATSRISVHLDGSNCRPLLMAARPRPLLKWLLSAFWKACMSCTCIHPERRSVRGSAGSIPPAPLLWVRQRTGVTKVGARWLLWLQTSFCGRYLDRPFGRIGVSRAHHCSCSRVAAHERPLSLMWPRVSLRMATAPSSMRVFWHWLKKLFLFPVESMRLKLRRWVFRNASEPGSSWAAHDATVQIQATGSQRPLPASDQPPWKHSATRMQVKGLEAIWMPPNGLACLGDTAAAPQQLS
ncbi:hypothetical protein QBC35DRAFT_471315 [Podospora australis]|uniref:Uncharacterized protein n=1 Tax=Podospora australis TaxID=1536484 RepID=A0AAN7ALC4_9PEZI|nr:hypothetical protein QBC35DRAFT_471315 [Podospora australis]